MRKEKNARIIKMVIFSLATLVLISLIIVSIIYVIALKKGMSFTVIISSSMEPEYEIFDTIVYSEKNGEKPYFPGDNLVFNMETDSGRIEQKFHKLMYTNEAYTKFYTMGINNSGSYDEGYRMITDILGSEDYHIGFKPVGLLIIFISCLNPWIVMVISILLIAGIGVYNFLSVMGPKVSEVEKAMLNKQDVEKGQKLLSKYNLAVSQKDAKKAKELIKKIEAIELRKLELEKKKQSEDQQPPVEEVKKEVVEEKSESVVLAKEEKTEEKSKPKKSFFTFKKEKSKEKKVEKKEEKNKEKVEKKVESSVPKKNMEEIKKKADKPDKRVEKLEKKRAKLLAELNKLEQEVTAK